MKRSINYLARALLIGLLFTLTASACSGSNERTAVSGSPIDATKIAKPTPVPPQEITSEPPSGIQIEPTVETPELEDQTPMPSPIAIETPLPAPTNTTITINGMPADQFIIMPPETRDNIRQIYAAGTTLGRNPQVFSILGDSLIATPQSLAKWDGDDNVLGDYAFLQPTLDHYAGSFSRYGVSVRVGLHSWSVFDPLWADKEICLTNEDLLTCEIRLYNPSLMIIFLGSNDAGSPGGFNVNYRQLVEALIAQGIVPVLATKADRFEGGDNVNNDIIRRIATDFQLPLLEFDLLADTLSGRGLGPDKVHLTYLEPLDYSTPEIFNVGYPVHNLASLMTLDAVRRDISGQN